MTDEQWDRIERLFHTAREMNPEDRLRFLDHECGADPTTRETLDTLLREDMSTHVLLDGVVTDSLATTLTPGMILGPYEVVGIAGIGGMGQVYRAVDRRLRRDVAIKALPIESTNDRERLTRLQEEAMVLASVSHENIAAIYDVIERQNEPPCLILEFVPGTTLAERLQDGPFPLADALAIAHQIALALEAAHAKGVVHRDLKPANIKQTPNGKVKVLDFGLARVLEEPDDRMSSESPTFNGSVGTTSTLAGTPSYMSPEQLRGLVVDRRTDIWAFGCVVYELLTGRKAFPQRTDGEIESSVDHAEPDWSLISPDTPVELEKLLRRCLQTNVNKRFNDASDLRRTIEELEKAHNQRSGSMVAASVQQRRRRVVIVGLATALLGVLAILVFPWQKQLRVEGPRQVTSGPELELDPAISPDGLQIAYASQSETRMDIYVRPLEGGWLTNVTQAMPTRVHRWPRWSPDETQLAFIASPKDSQVNNVDGQAHTIFVMAFPNGTPQPIATGSVSGFDWSPNGKELVFFRDREILAVALDGSGLRKIAGATEPNAPSWSPDGKWIAFVSGNPGALFSNMYGNQAPSSIWIVSSRGGEPKKLTDSATTNTCPVWMQDSKSLLFVSSRSGNREVFELKVTESGDASGTPTRLTNGVNALTINVSKNQLAYAEFLSTTNLWSLPIPKSGTIHPREATALTSGAQNIEGVRVSEDGNWIAFDSNRSGNQDIYKMPRSGGEPIRLTDDPSDEFSPTWSPDNKLIAYFSFRAGNRDIYVMNADGADRHQITSDPAQERYPDWSPDGQDLAFFSDKTDLQQIYVVSRRDGSWSNPRQITSSKTPALFPHYSPDGQTIAYIDPNGLNIMSPDGESSRTLVPRQVLSARIPVWGNNSKTLYFKVGPEQASLWSVPVAGGPPLRLVQFDDVHNFARVEFDTDGKDFFFTMAERKSDIWLSNLRR
jgi:serine/threonine protein kinase/dipeptidyl aminopeptidase/acylaminoacyl peptidase